MKRVITVDAVKLFNIVDSMSLFSSIASLFLFSGAKIGNIWEQ